MPDREKVIKGLECCTHDNIPLSKVPKDCLSCAQSFSIDDENGNMILVCVKDDDHHVQVQDDGHCEEWKD